MDEEKLDREKIKLLEAEIEAERKRHIKEAILELLKEHPKEIYQAALEILRQLRDETDRGLGRRIRKLLATLLILAIVGLAAVGYYWIHR